MPTIIVEDGTIVSGANSYITLIEARDYASARGVELPAEDSALSPLLIKAVDYLEAQRARYQGSKVFPMQDLQFPRYGVFVDSYELDALTIPTVLKQAQARLVMEVFNGLDLMPTYAGGPMKIEETVGPITDKWSDKVDATTAPEILSVEALLLPLFGAQQVRGLFLRTYRA